MIPKSAEAMSRIKAACAKSILFMGLDKEQQQEIFDAMEEIKVHTRKDDRAGGGMARHGMAWHGVGGDGTIAQFPARQFARVC